MIFEIDETLRKRGKTPHELSMMNLVACHLIAAPAAIVLDVGFLGFLIPLALSLSVIAFIWYRAVSGATRPTGQSGSTGDTHTRRASSAPIVFRSPAISSSIGPSNGSRRTTSIGVPG